MSATTRNAASPSAGEYRHGYPSPPISRDDVLVTHRAAIVEAAKRRNFRNIALVGSVARGDNTPDSDVDFLVETEPQKSTLFGLGGLINDLKEILGVDVDVALRGSLRPSCRGMLGDAIPL